jgi:hypothetical protein
MIARAAQKSQNLSEGTLAELSHRIENSEKTNFSKDAILLSVLLTNKTEIKTKCTTN